MTTFILTTTLVSLFLILHVYIGYPVCLWCLSKVTKNRNVNSDENYLPSVTLMISCYNEIDVVEEKIINSLALDYPNDQLSIIVISDGSDDGTDEVALSFRAQNVSLVRQEGRLGKTSAINLAMQRCTSDIVIFSDANAMYQTDAIKKLTRNFNDSSVGYVVGAALYTDEQENSAAASENLYWKYEIALKKMESNVHSVVGGDGAIYAIRRKLFKKMDAKDINDFVNPLQIIEQGFRGVFDEEAICTEETAGDFSKEYKRKQRIVNRSFRGLMKVKSVLNPFKFGFFSFQVISHKLLRWLQPIFILLFAFSSILLALRDFLLFSYFSQLGIIFLWLAQVGYFKSRQQYMSKIFFIPYYFIMVNYYSLLGVVSALAGNIQVTWSTPRTDIEIRSNINFLQVLSLAIVNLLTVILFIWLTLN
jgi:cellulose synthase/poly-beta-1,6-N-acetylglucosamine synthase-like glycosyltransferase